LRWVAGLVDLALVQPAPLLMNGSLNGLIQAKMGA
jgi:hypothetical protein